MSQQPPDQPPHPSSAEKRERTAEDVLWGRVDRKRERIRAEIVRNRAGGHRIPTWAMVAVLGLLLLGWAYLIFTN